MTVVAIVLAWLALSALFAVWWSRLAGPKSDAERELEDREQMEAIHRWPAYEEHA